MKMAQIEAAMIQAKPSGLLLVPFESEKNDIGAVGCQWAFQTS